MSFGSRSLHKPTADELKRWADIKASGCCVCRASFAGYFCADGAEIHHLLQSGLRISHRATVGLCGPHHAGVKRREFKARWPNQALLDLQDRQIDWPRHELPARPQRRKSSSTASPSKCVIGYRKERA